MLGEGIGGQLCCTGGGAGASGIAVFCRCPPFSFPYRHCLLFFFFVPACPAAWRTRQLWLFTGLNLWLLLAQGATAVARAVVPVRWLWHVGLACPSTQTQALPHAWAMAAEARAFIWHRLRWPRRSSDGAAVMTKVRGWDHAPPEHILLVTQSTTYYVCKPCALFLIIPHQCCVQQKPRRTAGQG